MMELPQQGATDPMATYPLISRIEVGKDIWDDWTSVWVTQRGYAILTLALDNWFGLDDCASRVENVQISQSYMVPLFQMMFHFQADRQGVPTSQFRTIARNDSVIILSIAYRFGRGRTRLCTYVNEDSITQSKLRVTRSRFNIRPKYSHIIA